jgi:hypothetical protein
MASAKGDNIRDQKYINPLRIMSIGASAAPSVSGCQIRDFSRAFSCSKVLLPQSLHALYRIGGLFGVM